MQDQQWQMIVECDATADGQFYYGVLTTGIFCRPSCKSRTPKRENVRIFQTPDEARQHGLRACKRCRPEEAAPQNELVRAAQHLLESRYAAPLSLQSIADRLHISPYHLQRTFKKATGRTPAAALTAIRLDKARELLAATERPLSDIALEVGYQNLSHFSYVFHKETGLTPTDYRRRNGIE
ncbi:AraC family transcriptional regulator of adaptative response / methylphosphotriester-DNA alkyltransferase methyltransferase [Tumebacillus sp. BK434]|uniref:bifunctional transcriptional activator/DNA repair enzyme AdaA n=1 Tax=Tumebacillus sp. BK434 TaxID=2512169 RepID=UPI001045D38E|nr:bifunctional transcriptional activator/DNA repair enzyme AdaA [Tumebacillus sp. BK434]TCP53349.1 AraC family transcriptional regulator of adaptative response / methylphosphotriester-DNA alkyltransferase methyltransferase [Tumebacillus sp. BK434]